MPDGAHRRAHRDHDRMRNMPPTHAQFFCHARGDLPTKTFPMLYQSKVLNEHRQHKICVALSSKYRRHHRSANAHRRSSKMIPGGAYRHSFATMDDHDDSILYVASMHHFGARLHHTNETPAELATARGPAVRPNAVSSGSIACTSRTPTRRTLRHECDEA